MAQAIARCSANVFGRLSFLHLPRFRNGCQIDTRHLFVQERLVSATLTRLHVECWSCGTRVARVKAIFCITCNTVQKPNPELNYYEILSMDRGFDLDMKELATNFRLMQMHLHPDRFAGKSEEEKRVSAEYSSLLNRAYKTLQSPVERGCYLLRLENGSSESEETSLESEFLLEIMEANEDLLEIESEAEMEATRTRNDEKIADTIRAASEAFKSSNWSLASNLICKLKYYTNIRDKIKEMHWLSAR